MRLIIAGKTENYKAVWGHTPMRPFLLVNAGLSLERDRAMAAHEVHALEVEGSSPSPAICMADTLENAIKENALSPKSASGDAGSVEQHSLPDQIAADKHLQSRQAMSSKGLGVKLLKISPGGTV